MPKKRRHGTARVLPVRTVRREDGALALEVGGVTQSLLAPAPAVEARPGLGDAAGGAPGDTLSGPEGGYWGLMLPPGCPRRALLLGLGGGSVATLLRARCPCAHIVGVERDRAVLALARVEFGLDAMPRLTIIEGDAFAWVEGQVEGQALGSGARSDDEALFDFIAVDLFEGGRLVAGTLATPFLRRLAVLLAPGGVMTINLMRTGRTSEQLHRLQRVFAIGRQLQLRGNLVLWLTPLPSSAAQGE